MSSKAAFVRRVFQVFVFSWMLIYAQSDFFTSMVSMESLVVAERSLVIRLKRLMKTEFEILARWKTFMEQVDDVHKYVKKNGKSKYVSNPVNSYLLLHRMNFQWKQLYRSIKNYNTADIRFFLSKYAKTKLPSMKDLKGAMAALLCLQNTYKIPSNELAKGKIPKVNGLYSQPLDVNQIYEFGRYAAYMEDWFYASDWLKLTLNIMETKSNRNERGVDEFTVLEMLAFAEYEIGHVRTAINLTKKLLIMKPKDKQLTSNMKTYHEILERSTKIKEAEDVGDHEDEDVHEEDFSNAEDEKEEQPEQQQQQQQQPQQQQEERTIERKKMHQLIYEQLCRGEVRPQLQTEVIQMKCWYKQNHPVLKLKPQKVERVWASPEIFQFHDILEVEQISMMIETALPKLNRSVVFDTKGFSSHDGRVSETTSLYPKDHFHLLQKLGKRAQACTGLDMKYTEALQIGHYGVGGQYMPHFDHAGTKQDIFHPEKGNRIATLLYYLSDVDAGGATVFVAGGGAVFPKKGDAILWYNLKKNGEGDRMTLHAGCPVLVGQKWIANWWIRASGQEFKRPCTLDKNE